MGIIELLILSLGAFGAVHGSKCIPETEVCNPYWVKMEPHKNLMETEEELNSWCRKQSLFFRCLEDVLLVKYGNYSAFPTNMLVSKMFSEDLCLEGSKSRRRYLDNAACINGLDMEYCTLPEYFEIVTPDGSVPSSKCSLAEETFSCIAGTMVMKCGFDAGRVYRNLLKVAKYEACEEESSEEETCEEVPEADKNQLSGIYYGLVHRFGSIPVQSTEADSLVETESISPSDSSILSEAVKKALDEIEDSSEEDVSSESSTFNYNAVGRNKDQFRKRPLITEPFKGLLFYNYSNEEFEFYWRQPGSFTVSRVTCDHVINPEHKVVMFECRLHYGYKEPECAKVTEEEERITPELIRDIDSTIPEDSSLDISSSPDWTADLRDYKRYRMSWSFFLNSKLVADEDIMKEVNRELVVEYPNPHVCSKELRFYDIINNRDVDWWQCPNLFSDELRNEILTFLFPNRTEDTDFLILTAFNWNNVTYIHFFEPVFHGFEKVACERVNECHPRGRGVWKCSMERRGIEGCDSCCVPWPTYAELCITERSRSEEAEREKESSDAFPSFEGSGALAESNEDAVTFVETDEAMKTDDESPDVTGVLDESGAVDFSEMPDGSNDLSTDDSLMFLRRNSGVNIVDSFFVRPEDALSVSEVETLHDLSEPDLTLFNNEIFVLQTIPSDVGTVYERNQP